MSVLYTPFLVDRYKVEGPKHAMYDVLAVSIVPTHVERVVPPAGERYAFEVQRYRRNLKVYVSPTGRSVRVFVDGQEVAR